MIKINLFKALSTVGPQSEISVDNSTISESSSSSGITFLKHILVMFLGIGALFAYESYNIPYLTAQLEVLQTEINEATTFNNKMDSLKKEIEKYNKDLKRLNVQTDFLQRTQSERVLSVNLISSLTHLVTTDVWLTNLSVRESAIELNGEALTETDINQFNNKLTSTSFLKDVITTSIQQKPMTTIKIPLYSYSIKASFVESQPTEDPLLNNVSATEEKAGAAKPAESAVKK
jgi:Tfp pilus assembly protein PilN